MLMIQFPCYNFKIYIIIDPFAVSWRKVILNYSLSILLSNLHFIIDAAIHTAHLTSHSSQHFLARFLPLPPCLLSTPSILISSHCSHLFHFQLTTKMNFAFKMIFFDDTALLLHNFFHLAFFFAFTVIPIINVLLTHTLPTSYPK